MLATILLLAACSHEPVIAPGTSDADAVKQILVTHMSDMITCYKTSLAADPSRAGQVDIDFSVTNGVVTKSSIAANTTGDETLGRCVREKVAAVTFPSGLSADLSYPFLFKAK